MVRFSIADGGTTLTLTLDESVATRLREFARRNGKDVETFAREQLEWLADGDPEDWASTQVALDEYDETGEGVDLDVAMTEFHAELTARLAALK